VRFLQKRVPKRDTGAFSRVPPNLSNTFSSRQLCHEPEAVRALLRKTAVDQLIEPGAEAA
jgi:hypothetical protein